METQRKGNKKIVLAGGPGSGKTTLINLLRQRGFFCFEEVSRTFIHQGKKEGKENFFTEDPLTFSQYLWEGRKKQYKAAAAISSSGRKNQFLFFDRGLADVTAYLRHCNSPQLEWEEALKDFPYDGVFLIAPEESIYRQDKIRMETFQEAVGLHAAVKKNYEELGPVVDVPFLSPEERCAFILKHCHER